MPVPRLALWWLTLYALWWLLVGTWSLSDAAWGAAVAALAAGAATVDGGVGLRPGTREWPCEIGSAALQTVLDSAVLAGALVTSLRQRDRGPRGRLLVRDTDAAGSDKAARRGWVTLVATWSPNAYVIDLDPAAGRALTHHLRPWRRSEDPG